MPATLATDEVETQPGPDVGARPSLAQRVAGSAVNLAGQFGILTLLSAFSTIAITRLLGPTNYGVYGFAVATAAVLGAVADFGFGTMLSRDIARDDANPRAMLRSAYEVAIGWSCVLALVMVALALTAPLSSDRGKALLILAPAMAFNGLNPAGALFVATYQTRRLVRITVTTTAIQVVVTIAVAAAGLGPVAVTAVVSLGSIVTNVIVAVVAQRLLPPATDGAFTRREVIRRSAPLGLVTIMTRVYLMIDLVLLGWYVVGPKLGYYAAASKVLTVLAGLAGVVMTGALPALASTEGREDLQRLLERVWHWLTVAALPLFIALALFAPLLIHIGFGHKYDGAVPLVRILCIAGAVGVLNNLVGNLMIARHKMRALVGQNAAAIVFNIVGNLILIPIYGVYAAAWMTVATEILVCGAAMVAVRDLISYRRLARASGRPILAIAIACAISLPFIGHQLIAAVIGVITYVISVVILQCWPQELRLNAVKLGAVTDPARSGGGRGAQVVRRAEPANGRAVVRTDGPLPPRAILPAEDPPPRWTTGEGITFRGALAAVAAALVVAVVVYAASHVLPARYTATGAFRVTVQNSVTGISDQNVTAENDIASQDAQLANSSPVIAAAAAKLHVSPATIASEISGSTANASNVVTVTANGSTTTEASARTQAAVVSLVNYLNSINTGQEHSYLKQLNQFIKPTEQRIAQIQAKMKHESITQRSLDAGTLSQLEQQVSQQQAQAGNDAIDGVPAIALVSTGDSASESFPQPSLYALIAFVIALLIGLRVAYVYGSRRPQQRSPHIAAIPDR